MLKTVIKGYLSNKEIRQLYNLKEKSIKRIFIIEKLSKYMKNIDVILKHIW